MVKMVEEYCHPDDVVEEPEWYYAWVAWFEANKRV